MKAAEIAVSKLVRQPRVENGETLISEPHYIESRLLLERVLEAIKADSSLARNSELAEWVELLPHLDSSPIDVSGPAAIAIESIIRSSPPATPTSSARGASSASALAKKLRPSVRQGLGLQSPAVHVVSGLLILAYPLFTFLMLVGPGIDIPDRVLGLPVDALVLVATAGALGSLVSLLSRVPEFARQRKADKFVLIMTGLSKPVIGTSFALFVYVLFESNLIPVELPPDTTSAYYAAIGFVAGFSERFVPDLVGRTERQFGGGGRASGALR